MASPIDDKCDFEASDLVRIAGYQQNRTMRRRPAEQGTLFGHLQNRPWPRNRLPGRAVVTVSAEAISAATLGGVHGTRLIAEAIHAARPDLRNVAVDLSTIRWTDPKTNLRATFNTPIVVRDALLAFARSAAPEPFRFRLRTTPPKTRD